jgi:hypothetical protein
MSNVLGIQSKLGIDEPFVLSFPWRITLGTFETIFVACLFATPQSRQTSAADKETSLDAAGA